MGQNGANCVSGTYFSFIGGKKGSQGRDSALPFLYSVSCVSVLIYRWLGLEASASL